MKPAPLTSADRRRLRLRLVALALTLLCVIGLAIAWNWSPWRAALHGPAIVQALQGYGQQLGPALAIIGFACALSVAVPLTFLTLVALMTFGAWTGFAVALAGALIGACISYGLGVLLGRAAVQHLAGPRVNALSARLARHGLLAVIAMRLVPVAPFAVINMVAGSSHIRLHHMLLGTAIGMTPGTLIMMAFTEQIVQALTTPGRGMLLLAALTALLVAYGALQFRHWLRQSKGD